MFKINLSYPVLVANMLKWPHNVVAQNLLNKAKVSEAMHENLPIFMQ